MRGAGEKGEDRGRDRQGQGQGQGQVQVLLGLLSSSLFLKDPVRLENWRITPKPPSSLSTTPGPGPAYGPDYGLAEVKRKPFVALESLRKRLRAHSTDLGVDLGLGLGAGSTSTCRRAGVVSLKAVLFTSPSLGITLSRSSSSSSSSSNNNSNNNSNNCSIEGRRGLGLGGEHALIASKAGLKSTHPAAERLLSLGDRLVLVAGQPVRGLSFESQVALIREAPRPLELAFAPTAAPASSPN